MDREVDNAHCTEAIGYLQDAVTEDVLRPNAFRVLGLSVYADAREIRRRERILSIRRFADVDDRSSSPLPLAEQASSQQTTLAVHRLRSPARRLDELFWFWPDHALSSLDHHPQQVLRHWHEQERQPTAWQATHNLGVFYLTKALDHESREITDGDLTDTQSAACEACWERGIRRWISLQQQGGFWAQYTSRVKHFDDPRFRPDTVPAMRQSLDEILLRGLTALVIRATRTGRNTTVTRCLRLMDNARLDPSLRVSTARSQLTPFICEIRLLIESAGRSVRQRPDAGALRLRELLAKCEPLVGLFDRLLPMNDLLSTSICDELCRDLLALQIQCTSVTDNWGEALILLRTIQPLARGRKIRQRLDENTQIVEQNLRHSLL